MTTKPTTQPHPRTARFRELWRDLGVDLPELARLMDRPRGTLTAYTHAGTGSRVPPQAVIDELDGLLLAKAKRIVGERGYLLSQVSFHPYDQVDHNPRSGIPAAKITLIAGGGGRRFEFRCDAMRRS